MNLINKQIISYIISMIVIISGLTTFLLIMHNTNDSAEKMMKYDNRDVLHEIIANGNLPQNSKKPSIENNVLHMKKGNYDNFNYLTLPKAKKYDGSYIIDFNNYTFTNRIENNKEINKVYMKVCDDEGNFQEFMLTIILEGDNSLNNILDYEGGVLK